MKKKIIYLLLCLIIIGGGIFAWYYYNNQNEDANTKFSLSEQQWLEKNKNNVVDFYIPANLDVFSYIGKGIFFDYLDSFTDETELKINAIPYKTLDKKTNYEYAFEIVDKVAKNQVLIYEDNYVFLSKKQDTINSLSNLRIGVIKDEKNLITKYINDSSIEFVEYESLNDLLDEYAPAIVKGDDLEETAEVDASVTDDKIDGFITLRSYTLSMLFEHGLYINYHLPNLTKKIVLTVNGDSTLNSIVKKYYQRWSNRHFEDAYNNHLLSEYFNYNNITEIEKNALQEKKYVYGFVKNGAYDLINNKKLNGINYQIIKSFSTFANVDMDYKDAYLSYSDLVNAFEKNKIDLMFLNGNYKFKNDYLETNKVINSNIVVLANVKNPIIINNFSDLGNKSVSVVKNSKIAKTLTDNGIKVKTYNSLDKLLANIDNDSIIAIDLENYEYYKRNSLVNYKIVYQYALTSNYSYSVNSEDLTFFNLFNFYLEYNSVNKIIISSYPSIYHVKKSSNILLILVTLLSLILILELLGHFRKLVKVFKEKTKHTLSKNDKLKYIDQLTSLKNRLYLNDSIEKWDNTSIYPQSIIIVNINDLSEINNNFGYEEGDKVILEAANILIRTQLPNTEIIRTDGSEFLIYMLEYDEKQTVAYLRKLNKELKELSHGYGAVTGYSMINDGIKTVDDAINEATLDVKTNKEFQDENKENNLGN